MKGEEVILSAADRRIFRLGPTQRIKNKRQNQLFNLSCK